MSKVSTNAARSFIHRTPRRENNTVVTVQNNFSKMFLHGNQIAWHAEGGRIGLSMCGWGTLTTRARLNAILEAMQSAWRIVQRKGVQYVTNLRTGDMREVPVSTPFWLDSDDNLSM